MRQQSFWNKRIPTLLALLLVVIGVSITAYITGTGTVFRSGASPSETPKNIRITNNTDNSFTITYTTDVPTLGSISFGKTATLGTVLLDDRDQISNSPHAYTTHEITVKNLLANTPYYFSIISGDTTYMNNTSPYQANTGPALVGTSPLQQVLSGSVSLPATNNGSGALVYLQLPNGQIVSTISDMQGNYHISLANIRTPDLLKYASVTNTDIISLIFNDGTAISHVTTTLKNFPMPSIVLSQDYDFTTNNSSANTSVTDIPAGFPLLSTLPTGESPSIVTPKSNQNFSDLQPEFQGIAQPNATITIVIHSDAVIQTQITADNNGQWTFRPSTPLSPGSHTITITTQDANGVLKTVTQNFTIFPPGSQVFDTATPSATIAPTLSPVPSLTVSPTTAPTIGTTPTSTMNPTLTMAVSPTIGATATPAPTSEATATPAPTSFIPSPTRAPLPSTGNASIFTIGIASIIMTIVGIGLFFLTRGSNV